MLSVVKFYDFILELDFEPERILICRFSCISEVVWIHKTKISTIYAKHVYCHVVPRSRYFCCRGKAIRFIYYECMFVALVVQHRMRLVFLIFQPKIIDKKRTSNFSAVPFVVIGRQDGQARTRLRTHKRLVAVTVRASQRYTAARFDWSAAFGPEMFPNTGEPHCTD